MKKIYVTISGEIFVHDYCSKSKDFNSNYYTTLEWAGIDQVSIDGADDIDPDEDMRDDIGDDFNDNQFFHKMYSAEGGQEPPIEDRFCEKGEMDLNYVINLEDNQEFDMKKLQIVRSEEELELWPSYITADYVLYDGKPVRCVDGDDLCIDIYDDYETVEIYKEDL